MTKTEKTEAVVKLRAGLAKVCVPAVVRTIFTVIVAAMAVGMMIFTVVSVSTFDRNDRSLFGYRAYTVRSDSMSATDFKAGDLILVKKVDPATLEVGDIVSFVSQSRGSLGEVVTHKIRSIITLDGGEKAFVTYGTTTGIDDEVPVTYENVLGKYSLAIGGVGSFFAFLRTAPGYVCCILLPFLILIVMQGITSVRLFRQYRDEEVLSIREERRKIAAELQETQRMAEELEELRKRLNLEASEDDGKKAAAVKDCTPEAESADSI